MRLNRSVALRSTLLAASSVTALVLASPAAAQVATQEYDRVLATAALEDMARSAANSAGMLSAQEFAWGGGLIVEESPAIISNNNLDPNAFPPGGVLNSGITGVGQQIAFVQSSPTAAGLSLCTGTLINPRTVITAAHCLNTRPAHMYGSNTGTGGGVNGNFGAITSITSNPDGTFTVNRAPLLTQGVPLSFGFQATNRCLQTIAGVNGATTVAGNGCMAETGAYETWRNANFTTSTEHSIYNVNQVWYDPRSLGPNSAGFLEADVALATLDTPALGIPTWTMLFTPLTAETHALSVGYGINGTSATGQGATPCTTNCSVLGAIDYRRRMVENALSVLGSLQDRNAWLFGPASAGPLHQSLYMLDFDSPAGQAAYTGTFNNYDFDVFNGAALPREGTTAGGDSGGPLVVDQLFDRPVTVGVLSGGSRFHNGQRFSTYGTHSFYQPLFLFWDVIVANNPYVYAGAVAGNGNWEDPAHWVQLMDPNYAIAVEGALVNSLPDTPALGVSGNTVKFGEVCRPGDICTDLASDDTATPPPVGSGTPVFIAGGPGTTNFVPDNVEPVNSADAAVHRRARYYDVHLTQAGTTTLSSTRTIDALTLDGNATALNIAASGTLNVLGEVNQWQGWTHVNGLLSSGLDAFIGSGVLSGHGTIRAPFVTVGAAVVAPGGGNTIGTLTVNGDLILSSASTLHINVKPEFSDRLLVTANASAGSDGILALNNGSVVFSRAADAKPSKFGGTWVIASAEGGVDGKFGSATAGPGVVKLKLTYTANDVIASMSANSFLSVLSSPSATQIAFANALDTLRYTSYSNLWNLYGGIDYMDGSQVAATFEALTPRIYGETKLLHDRQSRQLLGNVTDRLSLLGTGRAKGISFSGTAGALAQNRDGLSAKAQLGLASTNAVNLPTVTGLSGFVAVGGDNVRSSYGNSELIGAGQRSRYFASGVEAPMGDVMVGTAIGFAEATTSAGADEAKTRVTQAAAYASLPVSKNAYVGGYVAAERASTDTMRLTTDTVATLQVSGATESSRYMAAAEAGFRTGIGRGLSLNPRAQLGFSHYALSGFESGGETALELNGLKVNRIESRLGARLDGETKLGKWALRPNLQADYVRLLSGARNGMSVSFAAAPDYDFVLPLTNSGSGWMEVKGGVELTRGAFTLGLSGQATAGDAPISDQRGAIDLTFKF
jgi:subtilase-type serine protease